jgi:hypothetical protein
MGATQGSWETVGRVDRRRELVEARARGSGRRWCTCAGEDGVAIYSRACAGVRGLAAKASRRVNVLYASTLGMRTRWGGDDAARAPTRRVASHSSV